MTVEEYRNRMIEAFQNADCSNLIALVVLPKEKEFEHLEWLLKTHYKDEQSEDCISRKTAIDQFIHWYSELLLSQKEEVSFKDILKSLPSVLPQHKKGKWIRYDVDIAFHPLHCSICGWSNHHIINKCIEEFQFCPNCGADMRESAEEK